MMYTIGEMAELTGITPSTLRYYDKEGLLPFIERDKSGKRLFSDEDYEWLKVIECLKKTGMQLRDIRKFVLMAIEGDSTVNERLELIIKQRQAVEKQIADLQETLVTLDFKKWYYETAKEYGTTDVPKNMKTDELPEEFRKVRKKLQGK